MGRATRLFGLLLLVVPSRGWGGESARLRVSTVGECPSSAAVVRMLAQLAPELTLLTDEVEAKADAIATLRMKVGSDGTLYRVTVDTSSRLFYEEREDCLERARTAAVFAHSILYPPSFIPPAPLPVVPLRPAIVKPVGRSKITSALDLAGVFAAAPRSRSDNSLYSGGGGARISVGTLHVAGVIGAAGFSPVTLNLSYARARVERIVLDAGLRGAFRKGLVELAGEVSFALTLLRAEGLEQTSGKQSLSLDAGIRIAGRLAAWVHPRVAPLLLVETVLSPRPLDFSIDPLGKIGRMPVAWIGVGIGIAITIH